MLPRLSRVRVPFRRYLQTQSFRNASTPTKYALAVGTFATVAFFSTQSTQADGPSHAFNLPPPAAENFETFITRKTEETRSSALSALRSLHEYPQEPAPNSSPSEPASTTPVVIKKDAEETETSGGDSGGGAYNPETGEINWDCPCLGGMAQGPCGPEFREAFSCFIYSEDEPKGINCVEKFQGMQTCFREHPDVYASEIADDDAAEAAAKETEGTDEKGSEPNSAVSKSESAPAPTPEKPSQDSSFEQQ